MRALAVSLLFASMLASGTEPVPRSQIVPIMVTPRTYYVQGLPGAASTTNQGFNSNTGFLVTDEGVVVVDALGTRPLGEAQRRHN